LEREKRVAKRENAQEELPSKRQRSPTFGDSDSESTLASNSSDSVGPSQESQESQELDSLPETIDIADEGVGVLAADSLGLSDDD
jgi:hypothetical protein